MMDAKRLDQSSKFEKHVEACAQCRDNYYNDERLLCKTGKKLLDEDKKDC